MTDDIYTGSIETVNIGASGTYFLDVNGAQGGAGYASSGGEGAAVSGDIYLAAGTVLEIVVGGEGAAGTVDDGNDNGGGCYGGGRGGGYTSDPGGGFGGGGGSYLSSSVEDGDILYGINHGNGDVQIDRVDCFLEGTRILTPNGEVAVEALRIGDAVLTHSGAARPIIWIGQRRLDARLLAAHPEMGPVRVLPDAFGKNMPVRSLYLSPGHPVLVGADADGEAGARAACWCRSCA